MKLLIEINDKSVCNDITTRNLEPQTEIDRVIMEALYHGKPCKEGASIIMTEFVDTIEHLNKLILSDEFPITADSIINIQYNPLIKMYCVYWKNTL